MNPLIPPVLAADPSAHVWDDGDMVNWIDYGCVLSLENVPWAIDACTNHQGSIGHDRPECVHREVQSGDTGDLAVVV